MIEKRSPVAGCLASGAYESDILYGNGLAAETRVEEVQMSRPGWLLFVARVCDLLGWDE